MHKHQKDSYLQECTRYVHMYMHLYMCLCEELNSHMSFACVCLSPWTDGSTVRLMASTRPSGQPIRKQSDTSKSNRPGFSTRLGLLLPRSSTPSFIKLKTRHGHKTSDVYQPENTYFSFSAERLSVGDQLRTVCPSLFGCDCQEDLRGPDEKHLNRIQSRRLLTKSVFFILSQDFLSFLCCILLLFTLYTTF